MKKSIIIISLLIAISFIADAVSTILFVNRTNVAFEANPFVHMFGLYKVLLFSFAVGIYLIWVYWKSVDYEMPTISFLMLTAIGGIVFMKSLATYHNINLWLNPPAYEVIQYVVQQHAIEPMKITIAQYAMIWLNYAYPFIIGIFAYLTLKLDYKVEVKEEGFDDIRVIAPTSFSYTNFINDCEYNQEQTQEFVDKLDKFGEKKNDRTKPRRRTTTKTKKRKSVR